MLKKIATAIWNFLLGEDPKKDERAILIQQKVGMVMWRASCIMLFLWLIFYKRVARFEEWPLYCFIALMALAKIIATLYYNREI
jgi:hypothetical protein